MKSNNNNIQTTIDCALDNHVITEYEMQGNYTVVYETDCAGNKIIKELTLNHLSFIPAEPHVINVTCKIDDEENK